MTAWLALSEASALSGCLRMLPGSHRHGAIAHFDKPGEETIIRRGKTIAWLAPEDGVPASLKAREMSLHHIHTLHASGPNDSDDRRIGLTLSCVPTRCRPTGEIRPSALPVRGVDRHNHVEPEARLVQELTPEARRAHRRATGLYASLAGVAA